MPTDTHATPTRWFFWLRRRRNWRWWPLGVLLLWWVSASPFPVHAATPTPTPPVAPVIPRLNAALQGIVPLTLQGPSESVDRAQAAFAYTTAPTVWYPIGGGTPDAQGVFTHWDTTTLTDGDYLVRIVVLLHDGRRFVWRIPVRVRNYTPIETATPTPTATVNPLAHPSATPSPTPVPPTPLPPNPAALAPQAIFKAWLWGAVGAVVSLALLGLYRFLRR